MSQDTQWPRYQVFIQVRPGSAYLDAGSVHAPDPELALLNARDVFARRPECHAMWVVPVEAIYSRTAQQLETGRRSSPKTTIETPETHELYHVFHKAKTAGAMTWVGAHSASSPEDALDQALLEMASDQQALMWWVFLDRSITRSDPSDYASLYQPAESKNFRLSTDFRTITSMRKIKSVQEPKSGSSSHNPPHTAT